MIINHSSHRNSVHANEHPESSKKHSVPSTERKNSSHRNSVHANEHPESSKKHSVPSNERKK